MGIRRLGLGSSSPKHSSSCQASDSAGASTSGGARSLAVDDMSSNFMGAYKHRIRTLETENRRLMSTRGNIISETNRRLEMQIAEIRMLKEDYGRLQTENKELKDMCIFLQDERDKTQRLSNEWQKFGRYTSQLMKQEIKAYQKRMSELEARSQQMLMENDELKRLCLYLDEQRQAIAASGNRLSTAIHDDNSSDAGCGSSARSSDSEMSPSDHNPPDEIRERHESQEHIERPPSATFNNGGYSHEKEKALQMITQQMQTSLTMESLQNSSASSQVSHEDRLFSYVQSLENRIRQLEQQQGSSTAPHNRRAPKTLSATASREHSPTTYCPENLNATWPSLADRHEWSPRAERRTPNADQDRARLGASQSAASPKAVRYVSAVPTEHRNQQERCANAMQDSMSTSTMTSSGTTYCSSDTDESAATAVFVIGDELDNALNQLEVRTLGPIDEEDDETGSSKGIASEDDEQSSNSNATTDNTCYRVATPKILSDEVVTYRPKSSAPESMNKRDSSATQRSSDRSSDKSATSTDHHADNEYTDDLPPKMPLIAETCRLSLCSSDISLDRFDSGSTHSLSPSFRPASHQMDGAVSATNLNRVIKKAPPPYSRIRVRPSCQAAQTKKSEVFPHAQVLSVASQDRSRPTSSLSDAVKVLRVHELAAQQNNRGLNEQETAIVQQMCEVAWNSLDRKSRSGSNDSGGSASSTSESQNEYVITAHITSI